MTEKVTMIVTSQFHDRLCFKRLREEGDVLEVTRKRADELAAAGVAEEVPGDGDAPADEVQEGIAEEVPDGGGDVPADDTPLEMPDGGGDGRG